MLTVIFIISLFAGVCELCIHAEKYSTTYKKALYNDIKSGNPSAIEHYKKWYTDKNIYLFEEDKRQESDFLNLTTITNCETTEQGILLYTDNGNKYYIKK